MSEPNLTQSEDTKSKVPSTPLSCLIGATISGALATGSYYLMASIATSFANKPLHSSNPIVMNISSAVRTLVVGMVALASGVFALVTIGLIALGIQLLIQQFTKKQDI